MALSFSALTIVSIYGLDTPAPNTIYSVVYRFQKEFIPEFTGFKSGVFYPQNFAINAIYSATTDNQIFDYISGNTSLATIEAELDFQYAEYTGTTHPFILR